MLRKLFVLGFFTLFSATYYSADAKSVSRIQKAERLNIQAYQFYNRGQYLTAIEFWEQALVLYNREKQFDKVGNITIEISQAQKASGQGVAACASLQRYLKADPRLCIPANGVRNITISSIIGHTDNDVIAAMDFALILRNFGLFEQAKLYADSSLKSAKANKLTKLLPDLIISRANTNLVKLRFDRDRWTYQEKTHLTDVEAQELLNRFSQLFSEYGQQIETPVGYEAKLKWLTTYQELQKQSKSFKNSKLQSFPQTLRSQYIAYLQDIASFDNFDQFPLSEQLRVRHDIARILNTANQTISSPSLKESSQVWIENLITAAEQFNHQTYLASGYALLGERYQSEGKLDQALRAYYLASKHGQIRHPRYRWQHEIAKLHELLGNETQAEGHYSSAIALVEESQFNMSPLEQSVKTHFQESIRPIFDDYIQFQLKLAQPDFSAILALRNQYTEKVLETYLGCSIPQRISLEAIDRVDPEAAILSIFKINDKYISLLKVNGAFEVSTTDAESIESITQQLAINFAGENQKFPILTLNQLYQNLYQSLIEPISHRIVPGQTILFSNLQPELQRIPMALMFDGNKYLIQQNPIALIDNTLYEPQKINPSEKNILFAGLTESPNNLKLFSKIPFVEQESQIIDPEKALINKNFTTSNFSAQVQQNFSVVHIATHGQFSSDPSQTFLVAWNENITLSDLSALVESRKLSGSPIELLILSACETAKGDRLAALGMAGISIQSGARSTLASLWKAIDESSPFFMERFYSYLKAGKTKAKALQMAQIDMIEANHSEYTWGTYVLTGGWL